MATAVKLADAKLANRQRFKVWVQADNSGKWATNSLDFATEAEASDYAHDLYSRWTAVHAFKVCPVGNNPNEEGVAA